MKKEGKKNIEEYSFIFKNKNAGGKIREIQYTFNTQKKLTNINITKLTGNYHLTWDIEKTEDKKKCFEYFKEWKTDNQTKWLLQGIESDDFFLKE